MLIQSLFNLIVQKYLPIYPPKIKRARMCCANHLATSLLNRGADLNAIKELLATPTLALPKFIHTIQLNDKVYLQTAHPKA